MVGKINTILAYCDRDRCTWSITEADLVNASLIDHIAMHSFYHASHGNQDLRVAPYSGELDFSDATISYLREHWRSTQVVKTTRRGYSIPRNRIDVVDRYESVSRHRNVTIVGDDMVTQRGIVHASRQEPVYQWTLRSIDTGRLTMFNATLGQFRGRMDVDHNMVSVWDAMLGDAQLVGRLTIGYLSLADQSYTSLRDRMSSDKYHGSIRTVYCKTHGLPTKIIRRRNGETSLWCDGGRYGHRVRRIGDAL